MFGLDDPVDARATNRRGTVDRMDLPLTAAGQIDWPAVLDLFQATGIDDGTLCRTCGVGSSRLAQCRNGRRDLPIPAQIRILSYLRHAITFELLVSLLSPEIRSAVQEAVAGATNIRSMVIEPFFDQLDESPRKGLLSRDLFSSLAHRSRESVIDLASSLGLNGDDLEQVFAGNIRLPFRVKRAMLEHFSTADLGDICMRLSAP